MGALRGFKRTERGRLMKDVDGIIVPGGFGNRGIEGKIEAIRWARENKIPFLGALPGLPAHRHRVCPQWWQA